MNFEPLTIHKIINESPEAISILFALTENQKQRFNFSAGQYLTLADHINGEDIRRSYSIFTAPGSNEIGVTIKKLNKGRFSTHAHQNWKIGMQIQSSLPEGNFVVAPDHDKKRNHVFVAAGSGITPIMSMISLILEEEPMSKCYLLYGSRDENNIIFKTTLAELEVKYEGQLFVMHTLSSPIKEKEGGLLGMFKKGKTNWEGEKGRIDKNKVNTLLNQVKEKSKETHYYLCGPGEMIKIAEAIFSENGADKKFIHKEYFSVAEGDKKHIAAQSCSIKVKLNGEEIEFVTDGKKPILDELIALKKNPPYSCTSGACSSCIAKVISGDVKMEVCYALDDKDIESGLILTCQAKAVSAQLEISYDDV